MSRRKISIDIPDDICEERLTELYNGICAQTAEDEDGESWSPSNICLVEVKKYAYDMPDRKPDFQTKEPNSGGSDFWFEEMMMYCHSEGRPYPLRYDGEGKCLDFFDHTGDCYWIDLGDVVTKAYQDYCADEVIEEELSRRSRISEPTKKKMIEFLVDCNIDGRFGDGQEREYLLDGVEWVGFNEMNDDELLEEFLCISGEDEEIYIKAIQEIEESKANEAVDKILEG